MRPKAFLIALALVGLLAPLAPAPATPAAAAVPARRLVGILVSALHAPYRLPGDDDRTHLVYRVRLTNLAAVPVVPTSVTVRDQDGRTLQSLGPEVAAAILQPLTTGGVLDAVDAFGNGVLVMDVPLSGARAAATRTITTTVGYRIAPGVPVPPLVESIGLQPRAVSPVTRVSELRAPVLAPPVTGRGWVSSNPCCAADTGHAGARMTRGPVLWDNETFAVDLIRLRDGSTHSGDGTSNDQYYAWGAPVLSSTAGRVVEVRDGLDSIPPGAFPTDLRSIDDAGGNHVMVRAARGVYVYYAHLQKGSIAVRVGDRVTVGRRLGLLGNSGNTTGPHLHLQVSSGPDVFGSESLPYVFTSYVRQGTISVDDSGEPTVTGPARAFRRVYPTVLGVQAFR